MLEAQGPLNTKLIKCDAFSNALTEEDRGPSREVRGHCCYEEGGASCQAGHGDAGASLPCQGEVKDWPGCTPRAASQGCCSPGAVWLSSLQ